jgi:hypothetical protein
MTSRVNRFSFSPGTRSWASPAWKSLHIQGRKFNLLAVQRGIALQDFVNACTLIQHIGDEFQRDSSVPIDRRAKRLTHVNKESLADCAK